MQQHFFCCLVGEIEDVVLNLLYPAHLVCCDDEVLHSIFDPEVDFMFLLVDLPVRLYLRLVGIDCSSIDDRVIRDRDVKYLKCPHYI